MSFDDPFFQDFFGDDFDELFDSMNNCSFTNFYSSAEEQRKFCEYQKIAEKSRFENCLFISANLNGSFLMNRFGETIYSVIPKDKYYIFKDSAGNVMGRIVPSERKSNIFGEINKRIEQNVSIEMQGRIIGTINIFKNDDPIIKDHVKVKSVLCNCNITPPRYDSIRFDGINITRFKFSYGRGSQKNDKRHS